MHRIPGTIYAAVLALTCGACAGAINLPSRSPGLISLDELSAATISTLSAFEAIERLRPMWVQRRPPTSLVAGTTPFPAVLLNNRVIPDLDVLRSMRAGDLLQARFISPADATTRFGTGWANGLIEITLKRRADP